MSLQVEEETLISLLRNQTPLQFNSSPLPSSHNIADLLQDSSMAAGTVFADMPARQFDDHHTSPPLEQYRQWGADEAPGSGAFLRPGVWPGIFFSEKLQRQPRLQAQQLWDMTAAAQGCCETTNDTHVHQQQRQSQLQPQHQKNGFHYQQQQQQQQRLWPENQGSNHRGQMAGGMQVTASVGTSMQNEQVVPYSESALLGGKSSCTNNQRPVVPVPSLATVRLRRLFPCA